MNKFLFVLFAVFALSIGIVQAQEQLATLVVILVVDNFQEELAENPYEGDACALGTDGQRWVSVSGARWVSVSGARWVSVSGAAASYANAPHGEIVYAQIDEELQVNYASHNSSSIVGSDSIVRYDEYTPNGKSDAKIILAAVDTEHYDLTAISAGISASVNYFANSFPEYSEVAFVINMSFSIIPCDALPPDYGEDPELYLANLYEFGFGDFADLIVEYGSLERLNSIAMEEGNDELLSMYLEVQSFFAMQALTSYYEPFDGSLTVGDSADLVNEDALSNTLRSTIQEISENWRVISVAASGNYGALYSYPFAPAIWSEVLSVSAFDEVTATGDVFIANNGEVQVSGVFNDVIGSSFAAPRISADAAYFLVMDNGTNCVGAVDNSQPPLAHPDFDNLAQDRAVLDYCTEFPPS